MAQSNGIAAQIEAVLVAAKWPQGLSPEHCMVDIQMVLQMLSSRLSSNKGSGATVRTDSSGPGPHGSAATVRTDSSGPGPHG
jgi:hypothetical protein